MVALVAVSCTNEPEGSLIGKAKVTYTVDGPSQIATKAMGTISSAYTLYYEVRLWDGSALGEKLTGEGLSGSKPVAADQWPTTVTFDLARGKQYKILFWAQSTTAPAGLFTIPEEDGLTAIAINYTKMAANNEECDAFSGSDVITPAGAMAASATLTRPFALLNLGASDAVQFNKASGGATVGSIAAKIGGDVATTFNVANGEAGTALSGTFTATAAAPFDAYDASTLSVGETNFNYLSAVYVLPLAASGTIGVEYTIKDNATADITSLEVTNVPVKTNYRTNITGKLLTGTTTYEISVDQAFAGNTNKNATPTFASIAALNTFFASKIATGPNDPDNGDIFPESVVVTAIPEGDDTTITLPNDTLSVAINILVPYSKPAGLTIAYPVAEGAKHSQNVYFNMAGLSKLTANLPDTHLEVVCGSDIDLSDVYTSAGTFVVQEGARVGVLNIKQGNAFVAGSIDSLKVNPSATSDGQASGAGNAVQVFLAKESAVEKIVLNSKTDVVVEQPKDHIDVEATEKKVAVYVNNGAANSTATAQNGGVIYVEANVPCTVTAIGTSTAEEGTTVIVNDGASATGTVEVVATKGGAINLTANDDCSATATGSSGEVASTVTINTVETNVVVGTETTNGGEVIPPANPEDNKGEIATYVAQNVNTEVKYISLKAAVDAASADNTIKMIANSTENAAITVDKSINLNLNEKIINFVGFEETVPALLFYTAEQAIDVNISDGTLLGDDSVKWIVRYDAHGKLTMKDVVSNCAVANGQSIRIESGIGTLTDLNITTTNGSAGIYYCDSNTSGIATGAVTGCTINQQEASGGNAYWKSGIAISNGAKVTIKDCELTGNAPLFIFTSGGEFTVKDTEFHGLGGDYGAYDIVIESNQNAVPSIGLIYNDCTFSKESPVRMIAEGYPYAMAHYYVNAADDALIINSQADFTYAKAQEWPLLQLGNASGSFIDAGIFNNNPTACLAQDYKAVLDELTGHYSVIPVVKNCVLYTPGIEPVLSMEQPNVDYPDSPWNYEVSFNGQTFFLQLNRTEENPVEYSFADALIYAQAGQVIKLTQDVTVGSLEVPADVSIDFAGHTLTADQLSCKTSGGKFILKQSDQSNPYKVSFVGELEDAEIRGGSYQFDPTVYTPNGVGVVIPGQGEYAGGYYVPSVPEPKVFYANNEIVQLLGGLTIGSVLMYNPDGQRYKPYNTIGIQNGLYAFQADFNENENTTNAYQDWYADYVIYYDKAVNYEQKEIQEWDGPHTHDCPTAGLWGSYGGMTYAILMGENVPANYKCPLLGMVGWGWAYSAIRSNVKTFLCGPTNHSEANVGTTATVELRLYKSQPTMEGINAPGFKDYITVGRYVHPLDNPSLTPATDGN